jgi:tetratricopeptide (TPR) repeat protein
LKKQEFQNNRKKDFKSTATKSNVTVTVAIPKENFWQKFSNSTRLQIIFLALITFILYANTLNLKYTLDDRLVITDNKFTKQGIHGIKKILFSDSFDGFYGEKKNLLPGGRYRPLAQITFAIEYQIFGGINPFFSHLGNLICFALICILIFILLNELNKPPPNTIWYLSLTFITTVLYIAHPIHTEAVANTKGRDELFCMLFSLITILLVLKYLNTNKILYLLIYSVCFFLALMSKETAITFLVIIPLTIYFFKNYNFKKIIISILPLLLATFAYGIIRYKALGFMLNSGTIEKELLNNPYVNATISDKYATIFYTMALYFKLLIFPHPLTHDYYPKQIPIIGWTDFRAIISLLIFIFLAFYALKGLKKKNPISYWILFYLLTFSIVSNLLVNIGAFMNERFVFIPSLGFCFALSYFLIIEIKKYFKVQNIANKITLTLIIILFAGYSVKTITRNHVWYDDFTLFTTDVKTSENSAKCTVSAAGMLIERSEKIKDTIQKKDYLYLAIKYLQKGTSLHSTYIAGWVLYGNAYLYLDKYDEAFICYNNCININPAHSDGTTNMLTLGQNSLNKKRFYIAYKAFKRLLTVNPDKFEYCTGMAQVYENTDKPDSALLIMNSYVAKNPNDYRGYNRLGQIWGQRKNNIDMSLLYLNKAIQLKPDDASILQNMGVAYGIKGMYKESLEALQKALKYKPDDPMTYQNMANSYAQMKMPDKANECRVKAAKLTQEQKNKK